MVDWSAQDPMIPEAEITDVASFLGNLPTKITNLTTAADYWSRIGNQVEQYVIGTGGNGTKSLQDLTNTLKSQWSGAASDEFYTHSSDSRDFGLAVVSNAVGTSAQKAHRGITTASFYNVTQQLVTALRDANNNFTQLRSHFDEWTGLMSWVFRNAFAPQIHAPGGYNLAPGWNTPFPTFPEYLQAASSVCLQLQMTYTLLPSGYYNAVVSGIPSNSTGVVTLKNSSGDFTYVGVYGHSYDLNTNFKFNLFAYGFDQHGGQDRSNQDSARNSVIGTELYAAAMPLLKALGASYKQIQSGLPTAVDPSKLPKGVNNTQPVLPTGPTSPTIPVTNPANPYSATGAKTGTSSLSPTSASTGVSKPTSATGTVGKSGLSPVSGVSTSPAYTPVGSSGAYTTPAFGGGPGLDTGNLASFNPAGGAGSFGGSGLGASGLGALGSGAGGIGGVDGAGAGGLGAGAGGMAGGAGAAGAGAAGMAARSGMPMAPMGAGAGGGKDSKERQRKAFLNEDDDVWGADGGEAPPVL
jgi:hypothetical protein